MSINLKHFFREPLIQFLLLGTALFAIYSFLAGAEGPGEAEYEIYLTPDELLQMTVYFESQWKRQPNLAEFDRLLENRVEEEVLYREALAMGLDKDDTIVRRRMAQKMKFLAEDVATASDPTDEELRQWFSEHSRLFALPGRISFKQVYFSPDQHGERTQQVAETALVELAGQPIDSPLTNQLGDSIMLQAYFGDRSVETLAQEFGPAFAQEVRKLTPGSWQGPIESGLGWHLVYIDFLEPGRLPDFSEVEPEVRNAWLSEKKELAYREAYEEMRAKYTILLPAAPEADEEIQGEASP